MSKYFTGYAYSYIYNNIYIFVHPKTCTLLLLTTREEIICELVTSSDFKRLAVCFSLKLNSCQKIFTQIESVGRTFKITDTKH